MHEQSALSGSLFQAGVAKLHFGPSDFATVTTNVPSSVVLREMRAGIADATRHSMGDYQFWIHATKALFCQLHTSAISIGEARRMCNDGTHLNSLYLAALSR